MSITFRVVSDATLHSTPATIAPRQLAAFRRFARENGVVTDDLDAAELGALTYSFEADMLGFAIATVCALFDHEAAVIAVVEEAQFLGRRLRFGRDETTHRLTVEVAKSMGAAADLNLCNANAIALLAALGVAPERVGELALSELRPMLADLTVRDRFAARGLEARFEAIRAMAAIETTDQDPRLIWA